MLLFFNYEIVVTENPRTFGRSVATVDTSEALEYSRSD